MIFDFCGGLEEDLLRTNFILVYELIDEILVSLINILLEQLNHYLYHLALLLGLWHTLNHKS